MKKSIETALNAVCGLSYYEWLQLNRIVESYFRIKKGEHEQTLILSPDEVLDKAIKSQLG